MDCFKFEFKVSPLQIRPIGITISMIDSLLIYLCCKGLSIIGIISFIYLYCDIMSWLFRLGCQFWDWSHGRLKHESWEKIGLTCLGEVIAHFLISFCFCSFILVLVIEMKFFDCRYDTDFYILYHIFQALPFFFILSSLEMANRWDSTWHGKGTARVHTTRHDKSMFW